MVRNMRYAKTITGLSCIVLLFWCLYSYIVVKKEQRQEVRFTATESASPRVTTIITPHHLAAKTYIHTLFQEVIEKNDNHEIDRVIIISPNHFNSGYGPVNGSERTWNTPNGDVFVDAAALKTFGSSIFVNDSVLNREHGVYNLTPFVKEYFPQARIVPLAIRDGYSDADADSLVSQLLSISDNHTLLIVSVDFSHYLDRNFSQFHDKKSLQVLKERRINDTHALDVDCTSCLRIAMKYSQARNSNSFHLVARTSSLELAHVNIVGQETSHILGYYETVPVEMESKSWIASKGNMNSEKSVQLVFSGQVSPGMMSDASRRVFMGQDANIFFRDDVMVSHTLGMPPFHERLDTNQDEELAFNEHGVAEMFENDKHIAYFYIDNALLQKDTIDTILQNISHARDNHDAIIVFFETQLSSGGNEYSFKDMTHQVIDAGADMVINTTSQRVQSIEVYKGKAIFPSLGDMSQSCFLKAIQCRGIVLGIEIGDHDRQYFIMPVERRMDESVDLSDDSTRAEVFSQLSSRVESNDQKKSIQEGFLRL